MLQYKAEMTDTFGGEANYCWVERDSGEAKSELAVVRKVKEAFGMSGVRCEKSDFGDEIWLKPYGWNRIIFINFTDET